VVVDEAGEFLHFMTPEEEALCDEQAAEAALALAKQEGWLDAAPEDAPDDEQRHEGDWLDDDFPF
jgi:hypothetical protein